MKMMTTTTMLVLLVLGTVFATENHHPIQRSASVRSLPKNENRPLRRQASAQAILTNLPPKPSSDVKFSTIRYNVDMDSMQSWASRWGASVEPHYCKNNWPEQVKNLGRNLQYVVDDKAGRHHTIQFALAEASFTPTFNPNIYHSKAKYLKKYLESQSYVDALPKEFQGTKAPTLNIVLHPKNSVCVCQSWGPDEDRQFNIILSDLCFLGTAVSRDKSARGHPKYTLADGLAEWKQSQPNAQWSAEIATANEMRAVGNLMHEVGHCLQQTYDPVSTAVARANIAEYTQDDQIPSCKYLAHAVSYYASGKNGVMDLVSETYAGLALGVTFPKHVMDVYKAFGGLVPKVPSTDHQNYPLSASIKESEGATWSAALMHVLNRGRPAERTKLLKAPKPDGFRKDDKSTSEEMLRQSFEDLFKGYNLVKKECDKKATEQEKTDCYRQGSNIRTRCAAEHQNNEGQIERCVSAGVRTLNSSA